MNPYLTAAGLGIISGIRSGLAAAFVADRLYRHGLGDLRATRFRPLASSSVATVLRLFAGAELIADKFPQLPARTAPALLAVRVGTGALVGASAFAYQRRSPFLGAITGGVAALAGAFAGLYLRRRLAQQTRMRQQLFGVVEDGIAAGAGYGITHRAFNGRAA